MKVLVSVPKEIEKDLEDLRTEHYKDLSLPKMFIRIAVEMKKIKENKP